MLKNSFSYSKMKIHSTHFFHSVLLGAGKVAESFDFASCFALLALCY